MQFIFERLYSTCKSKPFCLLVIVVPIALYIFIYAFIPYSYTVQKSLQIPENTPIALPNHPTKYISLKQTIQSAQDKVFFSNYALSGLLKQIQINSDISLPEPKRASLHKLLKRSIQFELKEDKYLLIISKGEDLKTSKAIIDFYLEFILDLAKQGILRKNNSKSVQSQALQISPTKISQIKILEHTGIMTTERLLILIVLFLVSLALYSGLIIIIDLSDTTFKSERQAVRYLDMNLLGSIPKLQKIAKAFGTFYEP